MISLKQALVNNAKTSPKKTIFVDEKRELTNKELLEGALRIAGQLKGFKNRPVIIEMPKCVEAVIAMMGVLLSGNFYTILDPSMPKERKDIIEKTLNPECKIISKSTPQEGYMYFEDLLEAEADETLLDEPLNMSNPMYAIFTSGSTGVPKGVIVSHDAVMHYLNWFTTQFDINEKTKFGNQTPLYFSMSVSDVLGTIYANSMLYFIPHTFFSFPIYLMKYLDENKINTIYWVPSALNMVSNFKALDSYKLPSLKKVLFAGEPMPPKVINYFLAHHEAYYANLCGPTETTDICTFYEVKEVVENSVPIGKACAGLTTLVLKDGKLADEGELYIKGPFLAIGYYGNEKKTKEAFVQNPLNKLYPETVYRTGDLVRVREDGNLIYLGRSDFQIKHMGYRIELGEIENRVYSVEEINTCVVVYRDEKIVLYYVGAIKEEELVAKLKEKLPNYMMPNKICKEALIKYNMNGKIDRNYYKEKKEEK